MADEYRLVLGTPNAEFAEAFAGHCRDALRTVGLTVYTRGSDVIFEGREDLVNHAETILRQTFRDMGHPIFDLMPGGDA